MKAIIETGGKQYSVEVGKEIYIEKIDVEPNKEVVFDKVLMINNVFGNPYVGGSKVIGKVIKHGKKRKINIIHFRPKKNFFRKQGHRQPYTKVKITKIG